MAQYSVPSKDDMVTGPERKPLLGGEDYILRILEINGPLTKPGWGGKSTTVVTPKFEVVSFADGQPPIDIDEEELPADQPRWLWKDIELGRYGFTTAGIPSLARQFFLAANGIVDINSSIPDGDTDELVGKTVIATVSVYVGRDGKQKNKIISFKPIGGRRRAKAPTVEDLNVAAPAEGNPASDEYTDMVREFLDADPEASK